MLSTFFGWACFFFETLSLTSINWGKDSIKSWKFAYFPDRKAIPKSILPQSLLQKLVLEKKRETRNAQDFERKKNFGKEAYALSKKKGKERG